MQHIDENQLEQDLDYRYRFLAEFIGFNELDVATIHSAVGLIAPQISQLVEKTYEKLLAYDATARHFVPRQHGYEGSVPKSLDDLTANHEQIKFRKEHLSRYLMQLIGRAYDAKMTRYLDMVGKMHTPKAGSAEIDVPLVQMNALMGLISDELTTTVLALDLADEKKSKLLRAFNKLLWIQNDLINRHYKAAAAED